MTFLGSLVPWFLGSLAALAFWRFILLCWQRNPLNQWVYISRGFSKPIEEEKQDSPGLMAAPSESVQILKRAWHILRPDPEARLKAADQLLVDIGKDAQSAGFIVKNERTQVAITNGSGDGVVLAHTDGEFVLQRLHVRPVGDVTRLAVEYDPAVGAYVGTALDESIIPLPGGLRPHNVATSVLAAAILLMLQSASK
jgi:hypothetical protein